MAHECSVCVGSGLKPNVDLTVLGISKAEALMCTKFQCDNCGGTGEFDDWDGIPDDWDSVPHGFTYIDANGNKAWTEDFETSIGE